jgi:hypothetical protein
MTLAAADANDRADQLTRLSEPQAFEARRPQDAAPGLQETQRLANLYRHESARIRREPALLAGLDAAGRERLKRASLALDAVLARHARALEAAKTVTEGLVRAVAEELAAGRPQAAGYGPAARAPSPAAASLAYNRRA